NKVERVDIYLVPPLQGGKAGVSFHKPRVRTLGWFVKALQAYIDTVRVVHEPPLPTTLHSNLTIIEPNMNPNQYLNCKQIN
ncbi:hypothetical protein, partial [Parabacteroides sp.]|uniref:hypothetical protein n=1 Tax=Parabacteroides sp. TaxID=1869337 RepID=UPI00257B99E0